MLPPNENEKYAHCARALIHPDNLPPHPTTVPTPNPPSARTLIGEALFSPTFCNGVPAVQLRPPQGFGIDWLTLDAHRVVTKTPPDVRPLTPPKEQLSVCPVMASL